MPSQETFLMTATSFQSRMFSLAAAPKYFSKPKKSKPNFPSLPALFTRHCVKNRKSSIWYRESSTNFIGLFKCKKPLYQFAHPRFVYYTLIEVGLNQRDRKSAKVALKHIHLSIQVDGPTYDSCLSAICRIEKNNYFTC